MCNRIDITDLCRQLSDDNTKPELLKIAKHCGLSGYSRLNKPELCERLAKHLANLKDPDNEAYLSRKQNQGPTFQYSGRPYSQMYTLSTGQHCSATSNYLPVVRYEGLFYGEHDETQREYTGTFYFYEPSSCAYLDLGKTLVAGSKYDAFKKLWSQGGDKVLRTQEQINRGVDQYMYDLNQLNDPDIVAQYPAMYYRLHNFPVHPQSDDDFFFVFTGLTTDERKDFDLISGLIESGYDLPVGKIHTVVDYNDVEDPNDPISDETLLTISPGVVFQKVSMDPIGENEDGRYLGSYIVGSFDRMDVPLYYMALSLGYDTIVLQHEYGENRSVTEILDTRPRVRSFESICRVPNCYNRVGNTVYPLIWLPQDGFLHYDPKTEMFYGDNDE